MNEHPGHQQAMNAGDPPLAGTAIPIAAARDNPSQQEDQIQASWSVYPASGCMRHWQERRQCVQVPQGDAAHRRDGMGATASRQEGGARRGDRWLAEADARVDDDASTAGREDLLTGLRSISSSSGTSATRRLTRREDRGNARTSPGGESAVAVEQHASARAADHGADVVLGEGMQTEDDVAHELDVGTPRPNMMSGPKAGS